MQATSFNLRGGADRPVCRRPQVGSTRHDSAPPSGRQECLPHLLLVVLAVLFTSHAQAAEGDWPHPRGGLSAQGVAAVELADAYQPAWTYKTAGAVLSSAVIVEGVVYVGSEDKHLHAIDAATGKMKWKFAAGSLIDASPVVDGEVVYVGTDGGMMYAIDRKTGKQKWKFQTDGRISGEAAVTDLTDKAGNKTRVVLFGSHDGLLYCLDAEAGKKRWTYETGDYINCGVTINSGTVVLGGCDTYLHLVELQTGKKLGEVELGGEVAGTPALTQTHAYLGHMQNEVLAINLKTKKIEWKFHDRDFPYAGAPAIAGDKLLIGSQGRRLYCLNRKTGEQLWAVRTHGGVEGSPVIARKNRAVFGSAGGRLSIIDLTKGDTVWQTDIGGSINVSPAVTPGLIVVGSEDHGVYAFRPAKQPKTD